jgi:putative hydrolase of the HAD superfamily
MPIRAVLFDLFETLVTELHKPLRRASSLATELALDESAYKAEWKSWRPEIVLGRTTFHDALAQIACKLGGIAEEHVLERLGSERVAQKIGVLQAVEPEMLSALGELRRRGLKLAVVSNTLPEDVVGWERSPLRPFFDLAVFSCVVGLAKPDPEIYWTACRALAVLPQDALFVGDGVDEVAGARTAGLAAHRVLWFASKWPRTDISSADPGLRSIGEVVDAARGA